MYSMKRPPLSASPFMIPQGRVKGNDPGRLRSSGET
jgi:hypothetical protein